MRNFNFFSTVAFAAADKAGASGPEAKTGEIVTGNEVTAVVGGEPVPPKVGNVAIIGGKRFRIKEQLTFQVLKQVEGQTVYVKFLSAIETAKPIKAAPGAKEMDPAEIAQVLNLENDQEQTLIVNKVLRGVLEDKFGVVEVTDPTTGEVSTIPGYIGAELAVRMEAPPAGKRYKQFSIFELETV